MRHRRTNLMMLESADKPIDITSGKRTRTERGSSVSRSPKIRVKLVKLQNGKTMKNLVFDVTKTVLDVKTGENIERVAHVTMPIAESVEDMLTLCKGNEADVLSWFNFGRKSYVRTDASNNLGKADKATKMLRKTAKSMILLTGEKVTKESLADAIRMLLSNPKVSEKLGDVEIAKETSVTYEDELTAPNIEVEEKPETEDTDESDESEAK